MCFPFELILRGFRDMVVCAHLLDDGSEPAEGQAVAVVARDDCRAELDDDATSVLKLVAVEESALAAGAAAGMVGDVGAIVGVPWDASVSVSAAAVLAEEDRQTAESTAVGRVR